MRSGGDARPDHRRSPRFFTYYNLIFLGQAALTTLALTAVGCLGGFFFGFLMAAVRQTRSWAAWPLRALAFLVTELFRRIPFLVTLFVHVDAAKNAIAAVLASLMARIRAAGAENAVLSGDCGVFLLPPPAEGLREFLLLMCEAGFADTELRRMSGETPARLFGVGNGSSAAP